MSSSFAMPDFLPSHVLNFPFEICGLPFLLSTPSSALFQLYADYFRYYRTTESGRAALRLRIKFSPELPTQTEIIPPTAEFLAQIGQVRFWRIASGQCEQFILQTDISLFRIDPVRGRVLGLVSAAALTAPHLLANTYTFAAVLLLLRWFGRYHLHTAAVVSPKESLYLICGAQRAGKSTLTTALGVSGWQAISDDGVLLQINPDGLSILSAFKRDFHLAASLLSHWQPLQNVSVRHQYFDRVCLDGLEFFQTQQCAEQQFTRVSCVLFPHITGAAKSFLEPMSPSEAMPRLIEQSMFFPLWRQHTEQQMKLLTALVKDASFYRLHAGLDLWENPICAGALLMD